MLEPFFEVVMRSEQLFSMGNHLNFDLALVSLMTFLLAGPCYYVEAA